MKVWLYDDHSGWGRRLHDLARNRRVDAGLFRDPVDVDGGQAFVRMHLDPKTRSDDKQAVADLAARGVPVVPGARAALLYDDKVVQARELPRWMPETLIAETPDQALEAVAMLGFPLMSKAADGSASHNVRFVTSAAQMEAEIATAFGDGIRGQYGQVQRGYLLLQQFCPGNRYDFRVIAIGRERLILRRGNRDDVPMASGADREMPVLLQGQWPDTEAEEVLAFADEFFATEGFTFCGIDVVRNGDRWVLVEMTSSWPTKLMHQHRFVSGRPGAEYWDVVLDEFVAGALC